MKKRWVKVKCRVFDCRNTIDSYGISKKLCKEHKGKNNPFSKENRILEWIKERNLEPSIGVSIPSLRKAFSLSKKMATYYLNKLIIRNEIEIYKQEILLINKDLKRRSRGWITKKKTQTTPTG